MADRKTVKTTTVILAVIALVTLVAIKNANHIGILEKMSIGNFILVTVGLFVVCIATGGPAIFLSFWLLTHPKDLKENKKVPVD